MKYLLVLTMAMVIVTMLLKSCSNPYSDTVLRVRVRNLLNGYEYGLVSIEPEELTVLQEEKDLLKIADLVVKIEERN